MGGSAAQGRPASRPGMRRSLFVQKFVRMPQSLALAARPLERSRTRRVLTFVLAYCRAFRAAHRPCRNMDHVICVVKMRQYTEGASRKVQVRDSTRATERAESLTLPARAHTPYTGGSPGRCTADPRKREVRMYSRHWLPRRWWWGRTRMYKRRRALPSPSLARRQGPRRSRRLPALSPWPCRQTVSESPAPGRARPTTRGPPSRPRR